MRLLDNSEVVQQSLVLLPLPVMHNHPGQSKLPKIFLWGYLGSGALLLFISDTFRAIKIILLTAYLPSGLRSWFFKTVLPTPTRALPSSWKVIFFKSKAMHNPFSLFGHFQKPCCHEQEHNSPMMRSHCLPIIHNQFSSSDTLVWTLCWQKKKHPTHLWWGPTVFPGWQVLQPLWLKSWLFQVSSQDLFSEIFPSRSLNFGFSSGMGSSIRSVWDV